MKTKIGILVTVLLLMVPLTGVASYFSGSLLIENPSDVWLDLDVGAICPELNFCGVNALLFELFMGPKMPLPWLEFGLGWGLKCPNVDIGAGFAALGNKVAVFALGGIYNPQCHFALFGKAVHSVSLCNFCDYSYEESWDYEGWLQICNTFTFYFKDAYVCKMSVEIIDVSFRCDCPCFCFKDIIVGYRYSSIDICEETEWDSCFQALYLGCSWQPCQELKITPKIYALLGSVSECSLPFALGIDATMHF